MKIYVMVFLLILLTSCGGSGNNTTPISIAHTNFSGSWTADELLTRADLTLKTTDNTYYTGKVSITYKDSGLTLVSDVSGTMSWGFPQSLTCGGTPNGYGSRTWMVMPMTNRQGHLFSSSENITYADATLWDYATINFSQLNITWNFDLGSGSCTSINTWFHR